MPLIRWHGHACFEIVSSSGKVLVIDPHDGTSIGIKRPSVQADIVLISHDHFDHNAFHVVAKPGAEVIKMFVGERTINGIHILGVKTFHDKVGGRRRGENVVYRIAVDNIVIIHLGDLGHELDEATANRLKPVDVLLIPVGGTFTIGPEEAWNVIKALEPNVVIPMHYWIPGLNLPLRTVDEFISKASGNWRVEKLSSNEITISKETMPRNIVYVLQPP